MKPSLPQVDFAAQRFTLPLQLVGMSPWTDRRFTTWATQLKWRPWLGAYESQSGELTKHQTRLWSNRWRRDSLKSLW